jgi:hypothetical protein
VLFERKICYGHKLLPADSAGNNAIEISAGTACLDAISRGVHTPKRAKRKMTNFLQRALLSKISPPLPKLGSWVIRRVPICRDAPHCANSQYSYASKVERIKFYLYLCTAVKWDIKLIGGLTLSTVEPISNSGFV